MDVVDLAVSKDQPHDATTASQNDDTFEFEFNTGRTYSPAPEPGPSRVSHSHEVFNIMPQSESESEDDIEDDNSIVYAWFKLDTVPRSKDTDKDADEDTDKDADEDVDAHEGSDEDIDGAGCFENLRVMQGEEAHQLDVQQQLDDLGSNVLSTVAKDNIKAIAFKIRNQLTRNAFKGVQRLTRGRMDIGSDYVANQILEHVSGLSTQVYNCCVNTCVCFTGEFESHTTCPLCREPRLDKWNKA